MIINCTPHEVAIYNTTDCLLQGGMLYLRKDEDAAECPEPLRVYPAATEPARVTFSCAPDGMADGALIYRWAPREITGLPEPKPDTYYIVSKILAQACPERTDLIIPGTMVRSTDDHVVGCIDFSRV